ncbi:alpha-1,2-fucosyltransferase [Paenibacillus sp. GYB003]|uniref:alpha-1,2-fucosyltransferase n=1 Tax=Paenibacillus sp. GYB003 TaxID=2994392 RepID=UPI002F96AF31
MVKPEVTMTSLGKNGRFGNQLFQYAFLKMYARRFGLRTRTPVWIGQSLFGLPDKPARSSYPVVYENRIRRKETLLTSASPRYVNVDFWGYFQLHTRCYAPYREFFRYLFTPVPAIGERMAEGSGRLRSMGNTVVGLHIRRGDYLVRQRHEVYGKLHFPAPTAWYKEWLGAIWGSLDKPVLFVASDDLDAVVPDFREYAPVTSRQLIPALPEADFYPDFYLLSQCDLLAISNSTFSFSASMLNRNGGVFVRPDLQAGRLVPYDPWNSPVNPWLHLIGF